MIKLSQKKLIVKYLKNITDINGNYDWVRAYHLRGKNTEWGFLGHQADRRARELAMAGLIEHRIRDGFAEYRYRLNREPEMTQEQLLIYATQ